MRCTVTMSDRRDNEHQPGEQAPSTGHYEELNIFGTRTGRVHIVRKGDRLPAAPRGYLWRRIEEEAC